VLIRSPYIAKKSDIDLSGFVRDLIRTFAPDESFGKLTGYIQNDFTCITWELNHDAILDYMEEKFQHYHYQDRMDYYKWFLCSIHHINLCGMFDTDYRIGKPGSVPNYFLTISFSTENKDNVMYQCEFDPLGRVVTSNDKYSPYLKLFNYAIKNDIFEYADGGEADILLYNNDKKFFIKVVRGATILKVNFKN
jgi:hypothetical protein